jgi:hypothetical protein
MLKGVLSECYEQHDDDGSGWHADLEYTDEGTHSVLGEAKSDVEAVLIVDEHGLVHNVEKPPRTEVGCYDEPQNVCPDCGSFNISNEGPPDESKLFVTCHDCSYQWHEPEEEE